MQIDYRRYFSSFEIFMILLAGFRRRILDNFYQLFRKVILRQINRTANRCTDNQGFIKKLQSILTLQENIKTDNIEKISIITTANNTIYGLFDILGSGEIRLHPIDWHTDFKTGFKWQPGSFFRKYNQEEGASNSDVKIPRELSRCHHFLKLGLAYKLTHQEKYAQTCVLQMINWIDENPLMYSINWGCTMDVAIRAVNWIWTLGLISGSNELNQNDIKRIKLSLYQHGWFIWRNPEKELFSNSNHYLSDLVGQIHLGMLFNNLEEPAKWLERGKHELFHEIRMQILPSGMSYERSTHYDRLVLELILIPVLLLKHNGHEIPSDIWYRLEKMFEFIMYSIKPDGTSPIIGDQDNGRLLPFGTEELNDFRYLMSLGALLFNRPDFKCYGNGFNVYCLILGGSGAQERWNNIIDLQLDLESRAFPDSGIFILRDKSNYLLFNVTGKGLYPEIGSGTHTHSDLLSFELFTHGKSFLIDPGSYVYTADAEQRMLFRSTKMHNTVTIDNESQNTIQKEILWDFKRDSLPKVIKWESSTDKDIVVASHDGYARFPEPVIHERSITFDKVNERWVIKDFITGEGQHTCEWFFHFDTYIDFIIKGNLVETVCEDENNIIMTFKDISGLVLRKEKSFISKSYGKKEVGNVLVAMIKGILPVTLNIEIDKLKKARNQNILFTE
jgi:hypothetical protein